MGTFVVHSTSPFPPPPLLVYSPNLGVMEGKFVLKSNENYDAFLKTIGVPADLAAKMVAAVPKLDVSRSGTGLTVKTTAGDKVFSNTIEYGKDSVVDVAGLKYTINVKETADGYSGTMVLGGKNGTVSVEKTADGSCQTMSIGGVGSWRLGVGGQTLDVRSYKLEISGYRFDLGGL